MASLKDLKKVWYLHENRHMALATTFLEMTLKKMTGNKRKNEQVDFIKLKKPLNSKGNNKVKRQPMEWENICKYL